MAGATRRRRSDAAQNREAILAVALAALTEPGEVSLNAIAKRAGVANATLYRHFPTRESLVLEVYRHEVRQLVSTADQLLAEREPGDALREWVARLAQYAMTKHGLAQAIRAAASPGSALFEETYSPIVAALGKVLAAAGQAGVVRAGLDPDDVILALAGLWEIDPATDWKARARTLYDLVFTGLKADPPADRITSPLVRKFTGRRPQTCRPQLCGRANPHSVIKARFELRWLCARTVDMSAMHDGCTRTNLKRRVGVLNGLATVRPTGSVTLRDSQSRAKSAAGDQVLCADK